MKMVFLLSLSLMLIQMPLMAADVNPKESKIVEPITWSEFVKIRLGTGFSFKPVAVVSDETITVELPKPVAVQPPVQPTVVPVAKVNVEENKNAVLAKKIDSLLDGKLSNKGASFVEYGNQNSVDPYLIAAIAMHETANGKSNAIKTKNNVGGLMEKNGLKYFDSVDESIAYLSKLIKESYINNGLSTISQISTMYAPIGADNDPNGLNKDWVSGVKSIYSQMKYGES